MSHAEYTKKIYMQIHKLAAKLMSLVSMFAAFALYFHNLAIPTICLVVLIVLSCHKNVSHIKYLCDKRKNCKIWNESIIAEDCVLHSFGKPVSRTTLSALVKKQFDVKELFIDAELDEVDKKAIDDFLLERNFVLERDDLDFITFRIKRIPNSLGLLNKI